MIEGKRVLLMIPARGGSKRLPRKNVLPLGGKPMIAYSIEAAKGVTGIDSIIVSTDDDEIAAVATTYGAAVPFMRPAELASDTASSLDVWRHAVDTMEARSGYRYDILILIQPTSPLVQSTDITQALEELFQSGCRSCVTMCEVRERPEWMFQLHGNEASTYHGETGLTKRHQDFAPLYRPNGAVYVSVRSVVMDDRKVIDTKSLHATLMPPERSVDVDTKTDFDLAQLYLHNA